MPITVFDGVAKFSADASQLDQFIVKLEQGLSSASEKAAASTRELKDAQEEFRASIRAVSAEGGDTIDNLERLAQAEKQLTLAAAAAKQEHAALKASLSDASNAAGKMDYSFREARGGIVLVMDELGVHLPRELTMLLAHIPLVGSAFAAMLPIAGVVAVIGIIGTLIDKHEKLVEAERHAAQQSESLQIKQADLVLGLHAANLELEDQIRKLEGRPAVNGLLIAMINVKKSVDDLVTSYATDFQKMDTEVEKHTKFWVRLGGDIKAALAAATPELVLAGLEKSWQEQVSGNYAVQESLKQVAAAQDKLDEARRKLAEIDPTKDEDKWKAAAGAVAIAAGNVQSVADAARAAVHQVEPDATQLIGTLRDMAINATHEWQAMGEEIKKAGLEARKTNQEMANASAEKQVAEAKRALDAQLANIEKWKSEQHAAYG